MKDLHPPQSSRWTSTCQSAKDTRIRFDQVVGHGSENFGDNIIAMSSTVHNPATIYCQRCLCEFQEFFVFLFELFNVNELVSGLSAGMEQSGFQCGLSQSFHFPPQWGVLSATSRQIGEHDLFERSAAEVNTRFALSCAVANWCDNFFPLVFRWAVLNRNASNAHQDSTQLAMFRLIYPRLAARRSDHTCHMHHQSEQQDQAWDPRAVSRKMQHNPRDKNLLEDTT